MYNKKNFDNLFICENCTFYNPIDLVSGICKAPNEEKMSPEKLKPDNACEVFKPINKSVYSQLNYAITGDINS